MLNVVGEEIKELVSKMEMAGQGLDIDRSSKLLTHPAAYLGCMELLQELARHRWLAIARPPLELPAGPPLQLLAGLEQQPCY